jgi:uncharacterized protein with von Willebrand factor type A (vWA) domain
MNSPFLANLLRFARLLRAAGLSVPHDRFRTWLAALEIIPFDDRRRFKAASRAVLVGRHEEIALFDRAFDAFFREGPAELPPEMGSLLDRAPDPRPIPWGLGVPAPESLPAREREEPIETSEPAWSAAEVLRRKDFAALTPAEEALVRRLLRARTLAAVVRRTRRWQPGAARGDFDFRRTLRASLRLGGEPIHRAYRRRQEKPRPVVALLDVSGSMEPYSRLLLEFLYSLAAGGGRREVFAFGTRLTRLTRELKTKSVERALGDATRAVVDWGGGTRIGQALRRFNVDWGRRVLGQGALVLVVSDGLDRGDPALLGREMAHLARSAWRLVWLNPLLGLAGYEPLAGGMRAALPFLDAFLPVHNVQSLERLAEGLEEPDRFLRQALRRKETRHA